MYGDNSAVERPEPVRCGSERPSTVGESEGRRVPNRSDGHPATAASAPLLDKPLAVEVSGLDDLSRIGSVAGSTCAGGGGIRPSQALAGRPLLPPTDERPGRTGGHRRR